MDINGVVASENKTVPRDDRLRDDMQKFLIVPLQANDMVPY